MQLAVNFRGNDHCNLKLLLPIVFLFRSTRPATCIILYRHVVLQSALSISYVLGNTTIFGKSLCDQKKIRKLNPHAVWLKGFIPGLLLHQCLL